MTKLMRKQTVQESVTWIIPNKPIYVQAEHMEQLKSLMQGTADDPHAPLAGNLNQLKLLSYNPSWTP